MPYKLFSRRQAEANGELPDVFEYDNIPTAFRNQLIHVLDDTISYKNGNYQLYNIIATRLADQLGRLSLGQEDTSEKALKNFILTSNTSDFLDALDFLLYVFTMALHENPYLSVLPTAIDRIGYWMKYHSLGYEFINDNLIRIDNEQLHKEVVKPAFLLLSDSRFAGANEEMRQAYEARRTGNNADAIVNANKAFESAMKVICTVKNYPFDPLKDTASKLIGILKDQGYFPSYLDSHITGIRTTLESGLPVVRNKTSGHGQGATPISIPDDYVDYALNLLATNIVFLVKLL